jgi:hypothetical protein
MDSFDYLRVKYSSMQTAIASISIKFSMFPTPRNRRIEKSVNDIEAINPRRELAKSKENVKRSAVKKVIKNRGTTPNV